MSYEKLIAAANSVKITSAKMGMGGAYHKLDRAQDKADKGHVNESGKITKGTAQAWQKRVHKNLKAMGATKIGKTATHSYYHDKTAGHAFVHKVPHSYNGASTTTHQSRFHTLPPSLKKHPLVQKHLK